MADSRLLAAILGSKNKEKGQGEGIAYKKKSIVSDGKEKSVLKQIEKRPEGGYASTYKKEVNYKGSPEASRMVNKETIFDKDMNKVKKTVYRKSGDIMKSKEVRYIDKHKIKIK